MPRRSCAILLAPSAGQLQAQVHAQESDAHNSEFDNVKNDGLDTLSFST